ncbi:hypothetical protein [Bacillus sp. B15-48]|uniref:hypothetical protein n=1 Tax=Bacillus sp. B15-48 TaxID=1548601 RepID=UPI00193FBC76|nr:hypothetical protein [Bacillus sp. B15-48]MBM4761626.1 hypothetical protein [Bacillus sp. B15-48]
MNKKLVSIFIVIIFCLFLITPTAVLGALISMEEKVEAVVEKKAVFAVKGKQSSLAKRDFIDQNHSEGIFQAKSLLFAPVKLEEEDSARIEKGQDVVSGKKKATFWARGSPALRLSSALIKGGG